MQTSIGLRLARHGVIVLLLGLLEGFVILKLPDRGAGDAAHLVGLIGGFGLIALGLLWPKLALGRLWSVAGAVLVALSMYLNWLGLLLLGAFRGGPGARAGGLLLTVAVVTSLLGILIVLFGLRKFPATA